MTYICRYVFIAVCYCYKRLELELHQFEEKYEIERWAKDSQSFKDAKEMADVMEKEKLLEGISCTARQRWFLLNLKAKLAG